MNVTGSRLSTSTLRWSTGVLVCAVLAGLGAIFVSGISVAQEPTATVTAVPPGEAERDMSFANPSSAKPPTPAAVTVDVPAPRASTHKVLLLPPTFTEFQNAVSGLEAIPDWTDAARRNLSDAARDSLRAAGMQLEAVPDLTPQEAAIVREHVSVAMLIVAAAAQYEENDWHSHRANFDRTLGDGLRFLHDRTGADYALLIDGTQVRQSGGRIAMNWLGTLAVATTGFIVVSPGGGGEVLNLCLLDLNNGTVAWFNSSRTKNGFGSAGADMRNAEKTQAVIRDLFASYPNIPALAD
jgi:hypothetical protein